jgi:hypothetical protein
MRRLEEAEDSPFSPLKKIFFAAQRISSDDEVKTTVQH